jgi:hypothetical protein
MVGTAGRFVCEGFGLQQETRKGPRKEAWRDLPTSNWYDEQRGRIPTAHLGCSKIHSFTSNPCFHPRTSKGREKSAYATLSGMLDKGEADHITAVSCITCGGAIKC